MVRRIYGILKDIVAMLCVLIFATYCRELPMLMLSLAEVGNQAMKLWSLQKAFSCSVSMSIPSMSHCK